MIIIIYTIITYSSPISHGNRGLCSHLRHELILWSFSEWDISHVTTYQKRMEGEKSSQVMHTTHMMR
jgi:hypothetical protein